MGSATRIVVHPSAMWVGQGIVPFAMISHWSKIWLFTARHLEFGRKISIVIHIDLLLCLSWRDAMNVYLWLESRVHAARAHHIVSNIVR